MVYSVDNIVFEDCDTLTQTLTKIVYLNAGSFRLKTELNKLKVGYSKVVRGAHTVYILRGKGITDKIEIKL